MRVKNCSCCGCRFASLRFASNASWVCKLLHGIRLRPRCYSHSCFGARIEGLTGRLHVTSRLANCAHVHPQPRYKQRGWGGLASHTRRTSELPSLNVAQAGRALQIAPRLLPGMPAQAPRLLSHLRLVVVPRCSLPTFRWP